jgi:hypothetical protein
MVQGMGKEIIWGML